MIGEFLIFYDVKQQEFVDVDPTRVEGIKRVNKDTSKILMVSGRVVEVPKPIDEVRREIEQARCKEDER